MSEKKNKDLQEKLNSLFEKVYSQYSDVISFKEKIDTSPTMIDNIEEKTYDFEISKMNNLIFSGIPL